jgi:hypothetical protein
MNKNEAVNIAKRIARDAILAVLEEGEWTTVDGEAECGDGDAVRAVEEQLKKLAFKVGPGMKPPTCKNCGGTVFCLLTFYENRKNYAVNKDGFELLLSVERSAISDGRKEGACECIECNTPFHRGELLSWIEYWEAKK